MQKKVLIIGAGVEQVPAIEISKELGYQVITSDFNPNAPGMALANESFVVSTNDQEGNLRLAKEQGIDGVFTVCSETAVPVVGYVCDQLNLPGLSLDTAIKSTNKGAMRAAMEQGNVPMPQRDFIASLKEAEAFTNRFDGPWVLKPSDSSGQRGTNVIADLSRLEWAFNEAKQFSTDDMVLIDQFIEGPEINVTAIVKEGEVSILSLADRVTLPKPHFGIAVLHIAPASISSDQAKDVIEVAKGAVKAIGLRNGIAYPQIIVTENGARLIEIAARMPGGYNREMAMNLSGIDMIKAQILLSMGADFEVDDLRENKVYKASGVKLLTSVNYPELSGKELIEIRGKEEALEVNGIQSCHFHIHSGDIIPDLQNSVGRFAAIIGGGNDRNDLINSLEEAKEALKIDVK